MKKQLAMLLGLLLCTGAASAENAHVTRGTIAPGLPEMTFTVTDTGRKTEGDALRGSIFSVQIDGENLTQTFTYESDVSVDDANVLWMEDFNFDGYLDLSLGVGLGHNAYSIMALWDAENGCFAEPNRALELGNYVLDPDARTIITYEKDGAVAYTMTRYAWPTETASEPERVAQGGTYDTGDPGTVGERLTTYGTQIAYDWDEIYAADWFTTPRVAEERAQSLAACIRGEAGWGGNPRFAQVDHVDWVNLRKEDRKNSPSLAKLSAHTIVAVIAEGCGADAGWVRVASELSWDEAAGVYRGKTGYIWHSYLTMLE